MEPETSTPAPGADRQADVEHLEASRCWTLLRNSPVGRLGMCTEQGPEIFPVNFVVDGGAIVFRTGVGTKLAGALESPVVAFEVDGEQQDPHRAWSVVIHGTAKLIRRIPDLVDTSELPLAPWHASRKEHFVRITPVRLSGRSFPVVDAGVWSTALTGVPRSSSE